MITIIVCPRKSAQVGSYIEPDKNKVIKMELYICCVQFLASSILCPWFFVTLLKLLNTLYDEPF